MKIRFLLFALLSTFVLFGCSSENEDIPLEDNNEYYVKYEVYMPLGWSDRYPSSRRITFVTEKGEQSISTSESEWEGTYGPMKKGTHLYLKAIAESGGIRNNVEYYVRLSVSRNNEPFVVKGEQRMESVSSLSVSYTIDY